MLSLWYCVCECDQCIQNRKQLRQFLSCIPDRARPHARVPSWQSHRDWRTSGCSTANPGIVWVLCLHRSSSILVVHLAMHPAVRVSENEETVCCPSCTCLSYRDNMYNITVLSFYKPLFVCSSYFVCETMLWCDFFPARCASSLDIADVSSEHHSGMCWQFFFFNWHWFCHHAFLCHRILQRSLMARAHRTRRGSMSFSANWQQCEMMPNSATGQFMTTMKSSQSTLRNCWLFW